MNQTFPFRDTSLIAGKRCGPFRLAVAAPLLLATAALAQTAAKPVQTSPSHAPLSPMAAPEQSGPPAPAHPLTAAQAHEWMQLTGTDKIKQHLIDNIMAYTQRAFPPFVPADVRTDVDSSLQKMDVATPTVATYQRYLSTEDATKIIDFYKTPAGKNLVAVTPPLLNDLQKAALKQGQETFQAVMERHKTEIETAQKKYQAEHPAPTMGGPLGPTAPTPGASTPGTARPTTPGTKKPQ